MPVQQIELEEEQIMQVSDEALESVVGGIVFTYHPSSC